MVIFDDIYLHFLKIDGPLGSSACFLGLSLSTIAVFMGTGWVDAGADGLKLEKYLCKES